MQEDKNICCLKMLFPGGVWQSPKRLPCECGAWDRSVDGATPHAKSWKFRGYESERLVAGRELGADAHGGKKAALHDACHKQEPGIQPFHKQRL